MVEVRLLVVGTAFSGLLSLFSLVLIPTGVGEPTGEREWVRDDFKQLGLCVGSGRSGSRVTPILLRPWNVPPGR